MLLIIGLGNYPPRYKDTRHNFGFLAIELLAQKYGLNPWKEEKKFFGSTAVGQIKSHKVIFLKPETLMNLSGVSTKAQNVR